MYHLLLLDICLTISIYINVYIIYIYYIYTHHVVDLMECFALHELQKSKISEKQLVGDAIKLLPCRATAALCIFFKVSGNVVRGTFECKTST